MSRALGIPPHHSRLKIDDGSPDCDYCSRSGGTMSAVKRDGVTVYICHLCQNQGADRNPPPQVARETVVAAPTGEPAIPMKPLRQAGKTFDKDPLAGLGELGMPKK